MKPKFFKTPRDFRAWFERLGAAVDEALAFGWIDGVRRSIDGERYTIRVTPRKLTSIWSAVNIKRVAELQANEKAWAFYEAQTPYYRRITAHRIATAKRLETRARRIATLIAHSRKGERIPPLASSSPAKNAAKKSKRSGT